MATEYTWETTPTYEFRDGKRGRQHRRHGSDSTDADGDPLDGTGSLTYSAASSINSAAGESTDSSFADVMRVLDLQDSKELAVFLHKDSRRQGKDERSVTAESLAYSTDAESHLHSLATDAESALHGADLISTITGRNSTNNMSDFDNLFPPERKDDDPFASSNSGDDNLDIFFSPAEHTDSLKKRKDMKRKERKERKNSLIQQHQSHRHHHRSHSSSHSSHSHGHHHGHHNHSTPSAPISGKNIVTPTSSSKVAPDTSHSLGGIQHQQQTAMNTKIESRQGTPPSARPPKKKSSQYSGIDFTEEHDDVWYAKWWMFCFPDTVKNMTEKR